MTAPAAYLVRLKLSPAGYAMMESLLGRLNWLYNQALERRKLAYEQRQESLSFYDQCKWLTQLRAANEHYLIRVKGFPRLRAYSGRSLPLDAPLKAVRLTKRGRKWEASLVYEEASEALAVVGALSGSGSFVHELGHLQGVAHDRYQDCKINGSCPDEAGTFGFGYVNQRAFAAGAPAASR